MKHVTPAVEAEFVETLEPVVGDWLIVRALSGTHVPVGSPTLDDLDVRILRAFRSYPRTSQLLRSETAI